MCGSFVVGNSWAAALNVPGSSALFSVSGVGAELQELMLGPLGLVFNRFPFLQGGKSYERSRDFGSAVGNSMSYWVGLPREHLVLFT